MDITETFHLFDEKAQELYKSNFSQNVSGSGVTIKWEKGKEDKAKKSPITLNFSGIIYVDPTSVKK